MRNLKTEVGDIYRIPLPEGKFAYAQFIFFDTKYGGIVRIFEPIFDSEDSVELDKLLSTELRFPPVYVGISAAIKSYGWEIVDNTQVVNFIFPGFISTLPNPKTGEATTWYLWDGKELVRLGITLPNKYKKLEFLSIYSPDLIVERIISGHKPEEELILNNKKRDV